MEVPLIAIEGRSAAQPSLRWQYALWVAVVAFALGTTICVILTFAAQESLDAWITSKHAVQSGIISNELASSPPAEAMTCEEKKKIGPDLELIAWIWHNIMNIYLNLLIAAVITATSMVPAMIRDTDRNCLLAVILVVVEVAMVIYFRGFLLLLQVMLSVILTIPFGFCLYCSSLRFANWRWEQAKQKQKEELHRLAQEAKRLGQPTKRKVVSPKKPDGCEHVALGIFGTLFGPFCFIVLVSLGAIFALPVLSKYHIGNLDYAICFCLKKKWTGVQDISFSIGIFPFYAAFLLYKVYKVLTSKWQSPEAQEVIMGITMGFTIRQESLVFQAADSYSDMALLISMWGHVQWWLCILWLLATLVGLGMLAAAKQNLLDFRKLLLVKMVADDIPSLVMSIALLRSFEVMGKTPSEFNIYSLFSNFFSILATMRKLYTAPAVPAIQMQ